jgi:molybdenum cofactor synthesis domain-containing protein
VTIRFGVLTLSDRSSRGERADSSGPALAALVEAEGWSVVKQEVLPDNESAIRAMLASWADGGEMDVILTTGGTGFAPRDVTPEATRAVIDRARGAGSGRGHARRQSQGHASCDAVEDRNRDSPKNDPHQSPRQPKRCRRKPASDYPCPASRGPTPQGRSHLWVHSLISSLQSLGSNL